MVIIAEDLREEDTVEEKIIEIPNGYKLTELGLIPKDWNQVNLGDKAIKIGSGITPTGGENIYKQSGRPFIRSQNIGDGHLLIQNIAFIDDETHESFKSTEVKIGDVLLNITGASIGRCATANHDVHGGNVNQHVCIIRLNKKESDSEFLKYFLLSSLGQRQIDSFQAGGNREGLNFEQIRSFTLLCPSLKEQQAVVAALNDTDSLITNLDRLISKKRGIRQATMQQLLTGKQRLPGFSDEWKMRKLEDIADIDPENLGKDTNPGYCFKYISLEDVDRGILRGYTEQIFYQAPSRARRKIRKNDILISTVRPNLKSHLLIRENVCNMICSTGFSVLRCNPTCADSSYVYAHFFANIVDRQIESLLTGSNYPAINSKDLRALTIPIPSLKEQKCIGNVLSDMDAEIFSLEQQLDKVRNLKQGMMQELLTGRVRLV